MQTQPTRRDRGQRAVLLARLLAVVVFLAVPALSVSGASSTSTPAGTGAPAKLTNIAVAETAAGATVLIEASVPVTYTTLTFRNPTRVIVDIPNAVFRDGKTKTIQAANGRLVSSVKAGLFHSKPPVTRVVALLKRDAQWAVRQGDDARTLAIEIGTSSAPVPAAPKAPAARATTARSAAPAADLPPSLVVEQPSDKATPTFLATEPAARAPKLARAESAGSAETPQASTGTRLAGIASETAADSFRLNMTVLGDANDYEPRRLINPYRYVITIPNARLEAECPSTVDGDGRLVTSVSAAETRGREGGVEVTLVLAEPASCSAFTIPGSDQLVAEVRDRVPPVLMAEATPEAPEGTASEVAEPTMLAQAPAAALPGASGGQGGEELIDIDFRNADIIDVLSALAAYSDKNIITAPEVTGTVTVHLSQVTLEDALDLITRLHGYAWALRRDRTYIIATPDKLAQFPDLAVEEAKVEADFIPAPLEYVSPDRVVQEFADTAGFPNVTVRKTSKRTVLFTNAPEGPVREWIKQRLASLDIPENEGSQLLQLKFLMPNEAEALLGAQVPDVEVVTAQGVPNVDPAMGYVAGKVITLKGFSDDIARAVEYLGLADADPTKVAARPVPISTKPIIARVVHLDYAQPDIVKLRVMTQYASQGVQVMGPGDEFAVPVGTPPAGGEEGAGGEGATGGAPMAPPMLPYMSPTLAPTAVNIPTYTGAARGTAPEGSWIIVSGPSDLVDEVETAVKAMDIPPKQVRIRTLVVDMVKGSDDTKGLTWTLPGIALSETVASDGISFGKYSRGAMNFTSILDFIERDTNNKILARPTLTALHGKDATLLVGERIPYEVSIPGMGTVTRSVAFEEVGVKLAFNASVASDRSVQLYIAPEVSSILGFTPQGYPDVSTRQASTYMRLNDGDTVVLGGLLQDEDLSNMEGIPILRNIPLFGKLFEHRRHTKRTTELVIIATIEVMDDQGATETTEALPGMSSEMSSTLESAGSPVAEAPGVSVEGS